MTIEEMYGNAKALVEDRTYNIGEISEKTGLQKTANGWVKPKSNKKESVKSEQINKTWSQSDVVKSVPNGWKKDDGVTTVPNGYVAITNGKSRFGEGGRETKIIKEEYFKKADNKTTKAKKDASGADVFNNKHYKDDVRTAEGEAKIVSQMDTKGIQRRINELEALKKQNGGELGIYGERELKIKKAELEKRSGKSTSIPFNPKTLEYKEKNSKGEWETKKFEPEELLEEMQEMRKEYKTSNKKDSLEQIDREIAGLQEYIKNQNKQNTGSKLSPEKKQKWENDAKNSTIATLKNKVKAMEDSKGINPHAEEIIEIYNKELNERNQNSEKVYNDKSMKPIQRDSACRITADTKIRLKK